MLLTSYYTKSYGQIITENPDQYEQVWTGYLDTKDRRIVGEYIYHGQARVTRCQDCGEVLNPKTMTVGYQEDGLAHVVNGLARPIEVFGGEVFIIWVCSRQCTSCDKHQRMLPEAVKPWMRYALTVVAHVLFTLFEPEAFRGCHPLKGKTRRSFNALDFYGETSTIYRWRRRFAAAG